MALKTLIDAKFTLTTAGDHKAKRKAFEDAFDAAVAKTADGGKQMGEILDGNKSPVEIFEKSVSLKKLEKQVCKDKKPVGGWVNKLCELKIVSDAACKAHFLADAEALAALAPNVYAAIKAKLPAFFPGPVAGIATSPAMPSGPFFGATPIPVPAPLCPEAVLGKKVKADFAGGKCTCSGEGATCHKDEAVACPKSKCNVLRCTSTNDDCSYAKPLGFQTPQERRKRDETQKYGDMVDRTSTKVHAKNGHNVELHAPRKHEPSAAYKRQMQGKDKERKCAHCIIEKQNKPWYLNKDQAVASCRLVCE
jgi:hypothetical protein